LNLYQKERGKTLKPISIRNNKNIIPKDVKCAHCGAPSEYLYYNDGIKRSQIRCKICKNLCQLYSKETRGNAKYFCHFCNNSLVVWIWKKRKHFTVHKCYNKKCPEYLRNLNKLNFSEKILHSCSPYDFKLHYHFQEFHFAADQLQAANPEKPKESNLTNIRNSLNTRCLALTFHVSVALSARQTAAILKRVLKLKFRINQ